MESFTYFPEFPHNPCGGFFLSLPSSVPSSSHFLSLFSPLHRAVQLIYSQKTKSTVGSFRFRRLVPCSLTTTPNSSASRESHYEGEAMLPHTPSCLCARVLSWFCRAVSGRKAETERPGKGQTGPVPENSVCLGKQELQGLGARFQRL